jgi:two-component system LytT family response regulator
MEKMEDFLNDAQYKNIKDSNAKSRIPVPVGSKTVFVNKEDICYILASNYYIEINTAQTKYLLRSSMYTIIDELDSNSFVRIHRSSIVNLNYINELMNSAYGEIDVRMQGGLKLRVSKGYRKQFLMKMGMNK